jgi:hypothetical protein
LFSSLDRLPELRRSAGCRAVIRKISLLICKGIHGV